jgi:pseudouridylate synthase
MEDIEGNFSSVFSHLRKPVEAGHRGLGLSSRVAVSAGETATDRFRRERIDEATGAMEIGISDAAKRMTSSGVSTPTISAAQPFRAGGAAVQGSTSVERARLALAEATRRADEAVTEDDVEGAGRADEGVDVDTGKFGHTPIAVTDVLQERLLELSAERLRVERTETFLPLSAMRRQPAADVARKPTSFAQGDDEFGFQGGLRGDDMLADYDPFTERGTSGNPLFDGPRGSSSTEASPSRRGDEEEHDLGQSGFGGDATRSADDPSKGVLLLRALQRAGFCSRREAIEQIASGRVTVDKQVVRDPFTAVTAEKDIHVKGHRQRLRFAAPRLWMFHKPSNVVVGRKDDKGRSLFTRYASIMGIDHLAPVGSMPFRSHGLLMLTNDGDLARFLEHPSTRVQSTFVFRVRPPIDAVLANKLNTQGVDINGVRHKDFDFHIFGSHGSRHTVKVKTKGKTIPVHQMLQHLGRKIIRGGRVGFGPFFIGGLAPGSMKEVAVPPFYMKHVNSVWAPFVERDWPYFRQQRILKLKRRAQWRALSDKEREELDTFTFDEVQQALSFESAEVEGEADLVAAAIREQGGRLPDVGQRDVPLPPFEEVLGGDHIRKM